MLVELQARSVTWLRTLEDQVDRFPTVVPDLVRLYTLFDPMAAASRTARLHDKAIRALMRTKAYEAALKMLLDLPRADRKLIAECREGLGELEAAAADYLEAGSPKDALRCYRSVPDFDKSLELLQAVDNHPARESLVWLRRIRDLAAEQPADFNKVMLPAEKKLLEQVLETALGVPRKKPAARKAASKGSAGPRKPVPPKPKAAPRKPRIPRNPRDNPWF